MSLKTKRKGSYISMTHHIYTGKSFYFPCCGATYNIPLIRTTLYLPCTHTTILGLHIAHPASHPLICICIINLNNRMYLDYWATWVKTLLDYFFLSFGESFYTTTHTNWTADLSLVRNSPLSSLEATLPQHSLKAWVNPADLVIWRKTPIYV